MLCKNAVNREKQEEGEVKQSVNMCEENSSTFTNEIIYKFKSVQVNFQFLLLALNTDSDFRWNNAP